MPPTETKKAPTPSRFLAEQGGRSHTDQLEMHTVAKRVQVESSDWILSNCPDLVKQAEALNSCGAWLWFRDFSRLGLTLLSGGCTCKQHFLCPPCALRRSANLSKCYFPLIKHLLAMNPGWAPVLITRTLRNSDDLPALYSQLIGAHKKIMRARLNAIKANSRYKQTTVFTQIHGGAGSFEIKRGAQSHLWHPHDHQICLITAADWKIELVADQRKRKRPDGSIETWTEHVWKPVDLEARLRQEWSKLTGGSWRCDVRMIAWGPDGLIQDDDNDDLYSGVAEVMGYCLKAADLCPADRVAIYRLLRRRRMTYTWGCLRGVELPDEAYDDDSMIPEDEPWIEREYRWWKNRYNHTQNRSSENALFPRPASTAKKTKSQKKIKDVSSVVSSAAVKDWILAMNGSVPEEALDELRVWHQLPDEGLVF